VRDETHHFHEVLKQVRRQLEEVETSDPKVAQLLGDVMRDLEIVMGGDELAAKAHLTLPERLRNAARHFEESHPTLSATVGQLIDMLGQMGI
jgi:hypothetical protein